MSIYSREAYRSWIEDGIFSEPAAKLADHATLFWTRMKMGDTVDEALEHCEESYAVMPSNPIVQNNVIVDVTMSVFGDPLTRLYFVYLDLAQRQAGVNPFQTWIRLDNPQGAQ